MGQLLDVSRSTTPARFWTSAQGSQTRARHISKDGVKRPSWKWRARAVGSHDAMVARDGLEGFRHEISTMFMQFHRGQIGVVLVRESGQERGFATRSGTEIQPLTKIAIRLGCMKQGQDHQLRALILYADPPLTHRSDIGRVSWTHDTPWGIPSWGPRLNFVALSEARADDQGRDRRLVVRQQGGLHLVSSKTILEGLDDPGRVQGSQGHDVDALASTDLAGPFLEAVGADAPGYSVDKTCYSFSDDLTGQIDRSGHSSPGGHPHGKDLVCRHP